MHILQRLIAAGEEARLQKLRVRHVPNKDCFVGLPPQISSQIQGPANLPLAIEVKDLTSSGNGDVWHVAWAGSPSSSPTVIDVPLALAQCLQLPDGIMVSLLPLPKVPTATQVEVEPASEDDWELVELHAGYMEEQMLNQVGLLETGQSFPFWIRNQTVLHLRVAIAEPDGVVKLGMGTELAVAPRPRQRQQIIGDGQGSSKTLLPRAQDVTWVRMQAESDGQLLSLSRQSKKMDTSSPQNWNTIATTSVRISRETAAERGLCTGQLIALSPTLDGRQFFGRVQIREKNPFMHASAPACVLGSLHMQHHNSAALWPITDLVTLPKSVTLHPVAGSCSVAVKILRDATSKDLQTLVAAWVEAQRGSIQQDEETSLESEDVRERGVAMHDGSVLQLQLDQETPAYLFVQQQGRGEASQHMYSPYLLCPEQILNREIGFEIGEQVEIPGWEGSFTQAQPRVQEPRDAWTLRHLLPCLQWVVPLLHQPSRSKALRRTGWWKLGVPSPGGVLICSPTASSRSGLAALLGEVLAQHEQCLTHIVQIDCQDIETDTLSSALNQLGEQIRTAVNCLPSLLILDNLHLLAPAASEAPEAAPSTGTSALVSWLCQVLDAFRETKAGVPPLPVAVCATAPSATDLAGALRQPGRLDHCVQITPPGSADRVGLLETALASRKATSSSDMIEAVASKADGHDAADLEALVDRAVHAAVARCIVDSNAPPSGDVTIIQQQDIDTALEGFSSTSSWGLGGGRPSSTITGWQDVGGMESAKSALQEALELPLKYAKLLSRAPLRLRTGLLLYGPPGCGKTHIVAAAVAASGARFMSIKGPELLNKYIGASEAAVRDVFRQASAAAPCVLFFDEFDAIAPQRGHDSTGVTDRVVNQLLTELDGVEGLKGVIVLAATSRPDLLDAALLRPGRLDRLVYCGPPDRNDRLAILTALSRSLPLSEDANLAAIAATTPDFTGADLASLLADAQLEAVHALLSQEHTHQVKQPSISGSNLQKALESTRPSMPHNEREALHRVYAQFQGGKQTSVGKRDVKGKGLRTTLA